MLTKNPIENEIRAIIKVTGILWHNSPNNPLSPKNQSINRGILSQWSELIDKWIKDPSIPLIVRKDAQEGQVITHPSGREIIVTDNTFAVWVFEQVLKGYIPSLKWRFRSKGPQKTDDYFGVKPPKKDSIINKKGMELGSRASIFRSIATQLS